MNGVAGKQGLEAGSIPPNFPPMALCPQAKRSPGTYSWGDTPAQGPRPDCPP